MEAYMDLERLLRSGRNVVSTAFYPLLHPASAPPELMGMLTPAMEAGNSSVFVSGIDPGWALDILPALVSGVGAGITEIRIQEIFNYALYDAPDIVRNVIGLGGPMNVLPQMLEEMSLMTVWAPMVRVLADSLEVEIDEVITTVERRPLERTIEVPGMGTFEEGTMGAFRFQVTGLVGGHPLLTVEHITRIDDDCAPDWQQPLNPGGEHRVVMSGHPHLEITVHGNEPGEPGAAGGGNASAANRCVNAIPAVCDAAAGALSPVDLPPITGAAQVRLG
jgi:hypothetical protein